MPVSPDLIVFGVQSVIKLGLAAQKGYEQYVRDRDFSLPLLPEGTSERQLATQFFRLPEMQDWVSQKPLADHWENGSIKAGEGHAAVVIAKWQELAPRAPGAMPRGSTQIEYTRVRQWAEQDPDKPASPETRLILALADVALEFAAASPTLLAHNGASQPLLRAIAELATETRGVIPDLGDPEAWKDKKWLGANFGQSLLLVAFRAGLATVAKQPDLVADEAHVQRLIAATIVPLKNAVDAELKDAGGDPGKVIAALLRGERLRDEVLPGMVAAALRSVAADRNAFLGRIVRPTTPDQTKQLIAALAGSVLDRAAKLAKDDLLQRETWLDFFRAGVAVIATRPELLVAGDSDDAKVKALRQLVADVAGPVGEGIGQPAPVLLIDIATAALDSVHGSLPILLSPPGSWNGVAAKLTRSVIDGLRPAVTGADPAMLQRLASREQVATLVGIVLAEVATTPALIAGGHASSEVRSVLAAVATAMSQQGADLLHAEGWLTVAAAAARAAAANPGRLFRLLAGGDAPIGARLIGIALTQASASLAAAAAGGTAPFLAGPLLQDVIVSLLELTARRRLSAEQLPTVAAILAKLATEAADPNGRVLPSQVASTLTHGLAAVLDGRIKVDGGIPLDDIIKLAATELA